jgi:hypothetical protein
MRQSEDLQGSKPLLEDISKMSVSYIGQFAEDSDGRSLLMGKLHNQHEQIEKCEVHGRWSMLLCIVKQVSQSKIIHTEE